PRFFCRVRQFFHTFGVVGSSHRLSEVERTTPAAPSKERDHLLDGAAVPSFAKEGTSPFPPVVPERPCPADDLWVTLNSVRRGILSLSGKEEYARTWPH